MAADPGPSGDGGAPYHLFLTRIPPKLPKEEVEAVLAVELASRQVQVLAISIVPQSAWKNKGFGFVVLAGSPSSSEIHAIASDLDNSIRVGGKVISVRVCQASPSGGKPSHPVGPVTSWDQPIEKVTRLCAQVLHCYFSRRTHQEAYKAEKLLALLSMSIAPSCCQEARPISLWGREVYGSLEKMLLAIGESHFGGGWLLKGTIADRNAILTIGRKRHIQGWDSLCDPLPIATLLRLAASKQRLETIHTPEASSGFSTPTACRRCSDCGSLSAIHSTEQPSCSQSEASWSLRSPHTAPPSATENTDTSPTLFTPNNDTEATALSFSVSTTPERLQPFKSAKSCNRIRSDADTIDHAQSPQSEVLNSGIAIVTALTSSSSCESSCGRLVAGREEGHQGDGAWATRCAVTDCVDASIGGTGYGSGRSPLSRCTSSASSATTCRHRHRITQRSARRARGGCPSPVAMAQPTQRNCRHAQRALLPASPQRQRHQHQHREFTACGAKQRGSASPSRTGASCYEWSAHTSQPPSARDLLDSCARRLRSLDSCQPTRTSYAVADVASYLSGATEVLACRHATPYFSLEGYASAVYGSFENFLSEISRLHFNDTWRFVGGSGTGTGGCGSGAPRIMFRNGQLTETSEPLSSCSQ